MLWDQMAQQPPIGQSRGFRLRGIYKRAPPLSRQGAFLQTHRCGYPDASISQMRSSALVRSSASSTSHFELKSLRRSTALRLHQLQPRCQVFEPASCPTNEHPPMNCKVLLCCWADIYFLPHRSMCCILVKFRHRMNSHLVDEYEGIKAKGPIKPQLDVCYVELQQPLLIRAAKEPFRTLVLLHFIHSMCAVPRSVDPHLPQDLEPLPQKVPVKIRRALPPPSIVVWFIPRSWLASDDSSSRLQHPGINCTPKLPELGNP